MARGSSIGSMYLVGGRLAAGPATTRWPCRGVVLGGVELVQVGEPLQAPFEDRAHETAGGHDVRYR